MLGILVVAHEYGHYITAKLIGVTVEIFSVGFGPKIWSRKKGETEYRVSLIPLGGFVKMFGDNFHDEIKEEDKKRAFLTQPPPKKIAIAFAGPFFNFLLAIFLFQIIIMYGIPTVKPKIGHVLKDGPAYQAGFKPGDTILSSGEDQFDSWEDFVNKVFYNPEKKLAFSVLRKGVEKPLTLTVSPRLVEDKDYLGSPIKKGVGGVSSERPISRIWITDINGLFAKVGISSGDKITSINNKKVEFYADLLDELERQIIAQKGKDLDIETESQSSTVIVNNNEKATNSNVKVPNSGKKQRKNEKKVKRYVIPADLISSKLLNYNKHLNHANNIEEVFGFERAGVIIKEVAKGAPAHKAGLKPLDRIIRADGKLVESYLTLNELVLDNDKTDHQFTIQRGIQKILVNITKEKKVEKNRLGMEVSSWYMGITIFSEFGGSEFFTKRVLNPFSSFVMGIERTVKITYMMGRGLVKLIIGDISPKMLGGPIMIAKIANESMKRGFTDFLNMMAIISLNLALLNLLPIPVLDGGYLVIFGIEGVLRRPVNRRVLSVALGIGFWLLISLLVFTLFIDFARFGDQMVDWFRGLFGG